jgi:cation diffusion facilitator family transporter
MRGRRPGAEVVDVPSGLFPLTRGMRPNLIIEGRSRRRRAGDARLPAVRTSPMHSHDHGAFRHDHVFDRGNVAGERGTRWVLWITAVTMGVEIAAGWLTHSMALMADGFHMSSHAVAIGLSVFAYAAARRHADDPRFAFGTWKIEILGGFASAVFLLVVVGLMVFGSVERLLNPEPIRYADAMAVAVLGLVVNVVCALILGRAHDHGHGHHHRDGHDRGHGPHGHAPDLTHRRGHGPAQDLNLRAAYVHVLTDALTSVAAIVALGGGWLFGWAWLDPVMGIVGAVLVALWARGLVVDTGKVLLDREMDHPLVAEIRTLVGERGAGGATLIADLHVWRVGRASFACALSLVTHDDTLTPARVREWLSAHDEIAHATIEIQRCPLA